MKNLPSVSRLKLTAALIAAVTLTTACSSTQVKPAATADQPTLESTPVATLSDTSEVIDASDSASDTLEATWVEPTPLVMVDNTEAEDTATNEATRPARLAFKFGFNQATLDDENRQIVEQHGRFMAEHPEIKVTINGHSDSQGDSHYNDILSLKRAEHVADLLMSQGVMKEQIEIFSWGSTAPLADAQHNRDQRRVELKYVDEYFVQSTAE